MQVGDLESYDVLVEPRKEDMMLSSHDRALVLDFDGTVAKTFEPSPNGFGVTEAYEAAVKELFGEKKLSIYRVSGGLHNRSPREVVKQLHGDDDDTSALTEELVHLKISFLLNQIGNKLSDGAIWPRLTPGFHPFWDRVKANETIFTAILSSGHQACIQKTFEVHGLFLPHLIVTDDELRALPEALSKPDPRLWDFLLRTAGVSHLPSVVYIGDDQGKDGELARNANVQFLHFAPVSAQGHGLQGSFEDWRDVTDLFTK